MQRVWWLGVFGLLMILLGAYVAGGGDVICTRVGAPAESADPAVAHPVVGACRVRTTRWFGRRVVDERTYLRVTGVGRIAESRTESSGSSSRTVTDWSLTLMSNGVEIERIPGASDQVDPAYDQAQAWFAGVAGQPLYMDLSEWRFAYAAMGFGTLWLLVVRTMAKARSSGRRRMQKPERA